MTSDYIKHYLHFYYRFKRQYDYVATEVDLGVPFINYGNIADLAVCNDKELIEIEVKISLKDFKADFKKLKHEVYRGAEPDFLKREYIKKKYNYITPNKFYFAIPNELYIKEKGALGVILKDFESYGLIVLSDTYHYVHTRSKKLHNTKPSRLIYDRIARRSSAEAYTARDKSKLCSPAEYLDS